MNEIVKKNGINYGLIIGILGILYNLSIYLMGGINNETKFTGIIIQIIFWFGFLITRIIQSKKTKAQLNNFISFKDLMTTLTLSVTIGILISQIFTYTLHNFIDIEYAKEMNKFMNEQQVIALKAMRSFMTVTSEELKAASKSDNFSLGTTIKSSFTSILLSTVLNLILAAIFKSKSNNSINE